MLRAANRFGLSACWLRHRDAVPILVAFACSTSLDACPAAVDFTRANILSPAVAVDAHI